MHPPSGWRPALAVTTALAALGGRYGYHRDELYFVEAGRHPAFGYPDQPPLVPLLAAGWHDLVGGSLAGFRLLPAVLVGLLVLVAAATSAALGGTAREQEATGLVVALCSTVLAIGHLFSTSVVDLLLTATLVLLLVRAVTSEAAAAEAPAAGAAAAGAAAAGAATDRPVPSRPVPGRPVPAQPVRGPATLPGWLLVGVVAGVALQVKWLPALVLVSCAAGLLLAGPRTPLRRPGPWLAAGVALLLVTPNLWWQAAQGWPQLELSAAVAAGSSGTSVDRWLVVPLQAQLTGPVLAVPFFAGLVTLLRSAALRRFRWLGVGYLVLLGLVVATGGKPYYTVGLLPALVAAGVPGVLRALAGGPGGARRRVVAAALAVHVAVSAVLVLPVLPVRVLARAPVVLAVNYDAGETVGWPQLVSTVTGVVAALPPAERARAVVITGNYGEAGALSRARRGGAALPPVLSGHNGFWWWGPPPDDAAPVVLVGDVAGRQDGFSGCRSAARIDNGVGLENDEQGAAVLVCTGPARPWPSLWPALRRLG